MIREAIVEKARLLFLSLASLPLALGAPPVIIFDTDMGSDVDDAGALAVLHKLADLGEARIAGVVFSSGRNRYGAGVCDAINTWYGRGDLPLGQYQRDDVGDPANRYSEQIARATALYGHDVIDDAPELVDAYRRMLGGQPDGAVTIVTVGHPHGLAYLLRDTQAAELVRRKVSRWVAMGYCGTEPLDDWNTARNGAAAYFNELFPKWFTDLYVSWPGETVITGHCKLPLTPKENPVREAYRLWNDAIRTGRSSWDQVAVLFAVRPGLFHVEAGGSMDQTADLRTFWNVARDNPKHHRVTPRLSDGELAVIIEDLMSRPPLRGPSPGRGR
jgi:hypothetical protein